ncbi:Calcium/calmodulin-dependent protein kinase type 1 [Dictyocoela muelleri]|nr:Calcium/calmodulin-dependent protein kinase type 1 [Dictyocoela muelleri]
MNFINEKFLKTKKNSFLYKLQFLIQPYLRKLTRKRYLRILMLVLIGFLFFTLCIIIATFKNNDKINNFNNNLNNKKINEDIKNNDINNLNNANLNNNNVNKLNNLFNENKKFMPSPMTNILEGDKTNHGGESIINEKRNETRTIKKETNDIKREAKGNKGETKELRKERKSETTKKSEKSLYDKYFKIDDPMVNGKEGHNEDLKNDNSQNDNFKEGFNKERLKNDGLKNDFSNKIYNNHDKEFNSHADDNEDDKNLKNVELIYSAIDNNNLSDKSMKDLKDDILSFINQHVDYCLQYDTRDEQNQCFADINTSLPLKPIKMTLSTAVFKLGSSKVIKRVIMKGALMEDEISISLKHPNIINTLETFRTRFIDMNGDVQNLIWLVSEYIDGKITQRWVNRNEDKIRMILKDLLKGLDYMHDNGIVHMDLKIANMMLKKRDTIYKDENGRDSGTINSNKSIEDYYIGKLIDFGFSRRIDGNEVYIEGKAYGTYPYKPPEVIGKNIHGFSGDVWCVGAIAWFLSLGKTPFYFENGEKDMDSFKRFLRGKHVITDDYNSKEYKMVGNLWFKKDTSNELIDFIVSCLKRNRHKRPTVKELLNHDFILNRKSNQNVWDSITETYSSSEFY